MTRMIPLFLLLALSVFLMSCSGHKITEGPAKPNVAGAWEDISLSPAERESPDALGL